MCSKYQSNSVIRKKRREGTGGGQLAIAGPCPCLMTLVNLPRTALVFTTPPLRCYVACWSAFVTAGFRLHFNKAVGHPFAQRTRAFLINATLGIVLKERRAVTQPSFQSNTSLQPVEFGKLFHGWQLSGLGSPLVLNLWQLFGCRIHLGGGGQSNPQSHQKMVLVCRLVLSFLLYAWGFPCLSLRGKRIGAVCGRTVGPTGDQWGEVGGKRWERGGSN